MAADYSNLSVLVIDDQQVALQWNRGVLSAFGIERVVEARGGKEAVRAVTERGAKFDLILCDLRMPGKDGIETIRMLASLGLQCAVAVLSVEGERVIESAGLLATMRGLNLVGAVSKPLNEEKLQAILARTVEALKPKQRQRIDLAEADLAAAFDADGLEMQFQPKIHMFTGECVGAEAIVHWAHPRHGLLSEVEIMPTAERSPELLGKLTAFTVQGALAAAGKWRANGHAIGVSFNLSPLAFENLDLPDLIDDAAVRENVLPASVTVEVRESTLSDFPAAFIDVVARLRIKGFQVSLDDFSGRLSAVDEILKIPFSELKLSSAFVDGCSEVPAKRAVVEAGLAIARNLRLSTVALGIVNRPDWELLTDIHCDVAQGNFIARAMPALGFDIWLPQWMLHKQR